MNKRTFLNYIAESDFQRLFILEMGWNNPSGQTLFDLTIEGETFNFKLEAERNGFQVLTCEVNEIPTTSYCKKIDTRLRRQANDYICIYYLPQSQHHLWTVPVKKVEKRDLVFVEYEDADRAGFLFEKVDGLTFDIGERTTIMDVKERVQGAFIINSEKITSDFYKGFRKEHTRFATFITGIDDEIEVKDNRNKQWYASVMLNRLMFCYFIQKKGFLDQNTNYLRDKLKTVKQKHGNDQFYVFYRGFLLKLFHDGLNNPLHDQAFICDYGRIPYLNGGMFDVHELESKYTSIEIRDDAFESLFSFFDQWHWHLDDRLTASGKDINPDVLGYIFEQYINDRAQMGAYYTKEEITEYIGRCAIIPNLLEKVKKLDERPFRKDGSFWSLLKNSKDCYIFEAIKKGKDFEYPDYIKAGINSNEPLLLERRSRWNEKTPEQWALPKEIWRETIERHQRYHLILDKIERGDITQLNDFITYNLDIQQYVHDYLSKTENHLFVKHFYNTLQNFTILDPTCGSGAFLFAALNILEPLYEICISRMQDWQAKSPNLFKEELEELNVKYRSNIRYFIYKSIILRNLYGVDIMAEATEIAKLRLFLKMVAVVEVSPRDNNLGLEPLPDIDFNIRCGNTLVGYATKEELDKDIIEGDMFEKSEFENKVADKTLTVSKAFNVFKSVQLTQTPNLDTYKNAKIELKKTLKELNDLLNQKMFSQITSMSFNEWFKVYQPFHWFAEYYDIIEGNGGFDVIIGNPPYVEYTNKNVKYKINNYKTQSSSNLYAFVLERSYTLSNNVALIVQMSSVGTDSMKSLQNFILNTAKTIHFGCFPERPKQLFEGACIALAIIICTGKSKGASKLFGSGISRTSENGIAFLFNSLSYIEISKDVFLNGYSLFPKFRNNLELNIARKFFKDDAIIKYTIQNSPSNAISYRTAGGRYWKIVINRPFATVSTSNKTKYINTEMPSYALVSILNSNLLWWYYVNYFDLYNFKDYMIFNFRYTIGNDLNQLSILGKKLMQSYESNKIVKTQYIKSKKQESIFESFNPQLSKSIIDKIDVVLAKHYGFTEEELDFIVNYDFKYRMGDEKKDE